MRRDLTKNKVAVPTTARIATRSTVRCPADWTTREAAAAAMTEIAKPAIRTMSLAVRFIMPSMPSSPGLFSHHRIHGSIHTEATRSGSEAGAEQAARSNARERRETVTRPSPRCWCPGGRRSFLRRSLAHGSVGSAVTTPAAQRSPVPRPAPLRTSAHHLLRVSVSRSYHRPAPPAQGERLIAEPRPGDGGNDRIVVLELAL